MRTVVDLDRDTAILRHAAFGNIEPGKNLETRRQRQLNLLRQNGFHVEHAVDTEAQNDTFFLRFDVNIAGAFFDGQRKNVVGKPDDRCVFGSSDQLGCAADLFFFFLLNLEAAQDFCLQVLETLLRRLGPPSFALPAFDRDLLPSSFSPSFFSSLMPIRSG